MVHISEDLAGDWRRLDERIEALSAEIEELAHADATQGCAQSLPVETVALPSKEISHRHVTTRPAISS